MADFLTIIGNNGYNVGSTPSTPVAEQNQTYFAYFNGVGGTGPEYIDGTGYFIKYLIDINGNIINPEPYVETTSIEAVALHNLKNNFEIGKNAIVKTIEPNPTQDTSPNANVLAGNHRIAHVGKIVPILVTETGENKQNYVTTMSFGPTSTQNIDIVIPNTTAYFRYSGNEYDLDEEYFVNIDFDQTLNPISNAWTSVATHSKRILSGSTQTGTRIKMKIDLYLEETWGNFFGPFNLIIVRILKNGTTPIQFYDEYTDEYSDEVYMYKDDPNIEGPKFLLDDNGDGGVWTTGYSELFDYNGNDIFTAQARVWQGGNNSAVRVKGVAGGRNQSVWYVKQETPPGTSTGTTETISIPSVNATTSSYFISSSNYPNINGGYSVLTLSPGLTNMWQSNLIQNLPTASSAMGFSPINIPFSDIRPGDFIRFEYRKNQNYTIFNINQINFNGETALQLSVIPSLSSISGSTGAASNLYLNLDHFVIYRVLNDGLYVTLDVAKDAPGGAYTGLLLPEFISQELSEKLETLIQDLTQKEIIQ